MCLLSLLILMFSLSPSTCVMDFTCLHDMLTSPGVSLPRGDTELTVGSDPVNLTCHLNPDHQDYRSGVRSTELGFLSNNTILKSSIVNASTISSVFLPTVEGVTDISCVIKPSTDTTSRPSNKGVCIQRMLVGHKPSDISDFTCVSENWVSLNCSWSEPLNPVPTKYDIHFTTPGTWAGFKRCPSRDKLESRLKVSLPTQLGVCYLDLKTIPQYRPVSRKYYFYVNATNSLNPRGTVFHHSVDHFSVIRPGPVTQLTMDSQDPTTVQVSWSIPKEMTHFPPGLRQLMRFKSEWAADWVDVDTSSLNTTLSQYNISLPGPLIPYTLYTAEVAMVTNLPTTPLALRSSPVQAFTRTKPAPPTRPPTTTQASYEVLWSGGAVATILVYWQVLSPWELAGPDFSYQVRLDQDEQFSGAPAAPSRVTDTFAQFTNLPTESSFTVLISSSNSAGTSSSVTMTVPTTSCARSLLPLSVTKIYEADDILTLSWLPPSSAAVVTSYTLFWCRDTAARDRPYQCQGYLDWKTITTDQLNGSLSHSLVLPTDTTSPLYQLAVAANTATESSGMQWSTCTVKNDQTVNTRVTDVIVDTFSSTSVLLRWRLDCSKITGLVNSFVVKYCRLGGRTGAGSCLAGSVETLQVGAGQDSVEIDQLSPHMHYQFTVSVKDGVSPLPGQHHHSGTGPPSIPVTTLTLPAPPASAPTSLAAAQVSSTQATIAWAVPDSPNGEICKYLVILKSVDQGKKMVRTMEIEERLVVMSNLSSYTKYQVSVSACSNSSHGMCELCSEYWAGTQFTTLVGTPAKATTPLVRLVNTSTVDVEWNSDFQLGAPAVQKWLLRVGGGAGDEAVLTSTTTRVRLDLGQVGEGWVSACVNSSVYVEYYSFSVAAQVVDSTGSVFRGAWSDQALQPLYCTPALPWAMLVLGVTLVILALLVLVSVVYCCTWYRRKKAIIQKIGLGLDNREIIPVIFPSSQEHELGQLGGHAAVEEGQCTVPLRTHKNSSSSEDSGVCSQPASPAYQACVRQDSGVSGVSRSYSGADLSGYTRQDSGVSGLSSSGYISMGTQSTGYSVVGAQPYLPYPTPGYLSLGQVKQLVLHPQQDSGAYSRVGPGVATAVPGVARLKEEQWPECSAAQTPDLEICETRTETEPAGIIRLSRQFYTSQEF